MTGRKLSAREQKEKEARERLLLHLRVERNRRQAEEYRHSLRRFLEAAWPTIRPGTPFQPNWHVDCICEHLEALAKRQIRKLIINISPRSLKSTIISVAFPAWRWLDTEGDPARFIPPGVSEKFLCASYGRALALRDSRYCRSLIKSQWYQVRWGALRVDGAPAIFGLSVDQDEKGRFDNDRGGFRMIASVEGGILGEGGSFRLYDDPNDLDKMIKEPESYPQSVREWYSGTAASRSIDPRSDVALCVQQRASYGGDLTEYLLELGGWEHLTIPNEYTGTRVVTSIGWSDPRTREGELMFPARLGPDETATLKKEQRSHYCTPGYTPILMADWSEKRIEDVKVGDELVGYELCGVHGNGRQKASLKRATVTDISVSVQEVFRYKLASGRTVDCTQDHKWYRISHEGNRNPRKRPIYLPLKVGARIHSVYTPVPKISAEEQRLYDWLGGMLDGEGSAQARNLLSISQSARNRDVQEEIERVLPRLGFKYGVWRGGRTKEVRRGRHDNPRWAQSGVYSIHGGRSSKIQILNLARMVKKQRIIDNLWASSLALSESPRGIDQEKKREQRHKVISIEPLGEMPVYGLTTTTGNYVAWGFASQNSGQYQQSPMALGKAGLRREWFRFYNPPGTARLDAEGRPVPVRLLLQDASVVSITPVELPAAFERLVASWDMAFKDQDQNDFVAGQVWGMVGANSYLLLREHGHFNFPETLAAVRRVDSAIPGVPEKLVEDKANGPAVIAMLQNEIPGLIPVDPAGGKWSRVAAISGYVEAGNVYLPNPDLHPWVWELLGEFSAGMSAKHDDDTDAMSQALKRLYDGAARAGVPEFRVAPRLGEPRTASHIMPTGESVPLEWRRMVAVVPGRAALWIAETPSGALRVLDELALDRLDAGQAGREIARRMIPALLARPAELGDRKASFASGIDLLLPKLAFAPLEPSGSWAEMFETGILTFVPEDADYDARLEAQAALKRARFRSEMIEDREASVDRLRALLAFAPPNFQRVAYDRRRALDLADQDLSAYQDYMSAVDGEVRGEWPRIKIASGCKALIAELGAFRMDLDPPAHVEALLVGVSAPRRAPASEVRVVPIETKRGLRAREQSLLSRRFALGRR